jgi:predicted TPR repeat methyltransferase
MISPGNTADPTVERLREIEHDIANGRVQAAGDALNGLIRNAPGDPRVYLTAAVLAQKTSPGGQEIALLVQAVRVAPQWWPGYAELAKALARQQHFPQALEAAEKVVQLAPRELVAIEVAVSVATNAGDAKSACRYLKAALELQPDDVAIHRALGIALDRVRAYDEAEPHWRAVLAVYPDDASALGWLGTCLISLGRSDEALPLLERALELAPDHPNLPFHIALARGETPAKQPDGMIQQLFDGYADRFDQHLEGMLQYRMPRRVAEILLERWPRRDFSLLDLGCGTGLLGKHLGRIQGAFVGVDLSRNMLEKAVKLNVYSRLRLNEIVAEMNEIPPASFDCVTACDVFVYVGDLRDTLAGCHKVLREGGVAVFSCETAEEHEGPHVLRMSKRYAHARSATAALCREVGFRTVLLEDIELRIDGTVDGKAIQGFIARAEK